MLSVENPPDPSCSYDVSGLKADERAADKLPSEETDLAKPGFFSIRNYVLSARSKGIGTNWPFQPQFLQICLKHGVRELLPPFEPPDSLRTQCSSRATAEPAKVVEEKAPSEANISDDGKDASGSVDAKVDNIVSKSSCIETSDGNQDSSPTDVDLIRLPGDGKFHKPSEPVGLNEPSGEDERKLAIAAHVQKEPQSPPTNKLSCSACQTSNRSEESVVFSKKTQPSFEPQENKRRLIIKFGGASESSQAEEIVSNSSSVLDPMASKVCPVCKTFSSSSNTTLNAHIDQCLSEESRAREIVTKSTKPLKVKPRKKRSMVDICATAPRCTLEELERRNGWNRAVDSASETPGGEASSEKKRPRWGPTDFCDDRHESAVYVDSSGTKVRILSKFDDTSVVGEDKKLRKAPEDKRLSVSKKHGLKGSKSLRRKLPKKKVYSMKLCEDKIDEQSHGRCQVGNQGNDECLFQLLKARETEKAMGPPGSLRQWMCSKRTGLSKKPDDKDSSSYNPLIQSGHGVSIRSSTQQNHILKLSRKRENLVPGSKISGEEVIRDSLNEMDNVEKKSSHLSSTDVHFSTKVHFGKCSTSKIPRSPGKHVHCPQTKRVGVFGIDGEASHFSSKGKKISNARKSGLHRQSFTTAESNMCNDKEDVLGVKKSCKDSSSVQSSQQIRRPRSSDVRGPGNHNLNKISWTHRLGQFEKFKNSCVEEYSTKLFEGGKRLRSTKESSSDTESAVSTPFESDDPESASEVTPEDEGMTMASHVERASDSVFCAEGLSENDVSTNSSERQSDSSALADTQSLPVPQIAAWGETVARRCHGDQEMHYDNNGARNSSHNSDLDARAEESSLSEAQTMGSRGGSERIEEPELCIPSFEDMGYEVLRENSSITASNIYSIQDREKPRDPSPSPVSATSTDSFKPRSRSIPFPNVGDKLTESHTHDGDLLFNAMDNKIGSALASSLDTEGKDRSTIFACNAVQKSSEDQPCRCSRKDITSRRYPESQFFRQSILTSSSFSKGKPENSNGIRVIPGISASSMSCHPSNLDIPSFESLVPTKATYLDASRKLVNNSDLGLGGASSQTHTQSNSSPVLRLMGKDLKVACKEDDEFVKLQKTSSVAATDYPNAKYLKLGFSSSNAFIQDKSLLCRGIAAGSAVYGQDKCISESNSGVSLLSRFRGNIDSKTHQNPQEMWMGDFSGSRQFDYLSQQMRLNKRFNPPSGYAYNMEDSNPHLPQKYATADQFSESTREVIVIDDSPESEAETKMSMEPTAARLNQRAFGSGLPSSASDFTSRPVKAFSSFKKHNVFPKDEPAGLRSGLAIPVPCPGAIPGLPARGGNDFKSSGVIPQRPFVLSSTGYLTPAVYYSSSPMQTK